MLALVVVTCGSALAAVVGWYIAIAILGPFYRVMTILQAQYSSPLITADTRYSGFLGTYVHLLLNHGLLSPWHGAGALVYAGCFENLLGFIYRKTMEPLLKIFNIDENNNAFTKFAFAAISRPASLLVAYPFYLAYVHMSLDLGIGAIYQFKGVWDCLSFIFSQGGLTSLYAGYAIYAAESTISYMFNQYIMKPLKKYLRSNSNSHNAWYAEYVVLIVAATCTLLCWPLTSISYNLALQAGRSDVLYTGVIDCAQKLYAEGGVMAFYGSKMIVALNICIGAWFSAVDDKPKDNHASHEKAE